MNNLGNNRFKKELESESLIYFNEKYEEVTGDFLEIVKICERPDFICKRKDGTLVGVELVQVCRGDPIMRSHDINVNKNLTMVPDRVQDLIQFLLYEKDKKRKSEDWKFPNQTILIIQLKESPLHEISNALSKESFFDLTDYGFIEIWVSDESEIEAYDDIELFCLFPSILRRYYKRPIKKPFG